MEHIRRQAQKRNTTPQPAAQPIPPATSYSTPVQATPPTRPTVTPQEPMSLEAYRKLYRQNAGAMAYQTMRGTDNGVPVISAPMSADDVRRKYGLAKADDVAKRFAACFAEGLDWLNAPLPTAQNENEPTPASLSADISSQTDDNPTTIDNENTTKPTPVDNQQSNEPEIATELPFIGDILDNANSTPASQQPTENNPVAPQPSNDVAQPKSIDKKAPKSNSSSTADEWGFGMPDTDSDGAWNF